VAGYYYCWEFAFLLPLDSWNLGILNGSCISIGFMKLLLLLLHQHVPFLSKKILHSIPFCRTSHV
jgi:hypothetical protein